MRKAFKIVLATGVIFVASWISLALGVVFLLMFIAKAVIARIARGRQDVAETPSPNVFWEEDEQRVFNPGTGYSMSNRGSVDAMGNFFGEDARIE